MLKEIAEFILLALVVVDIYFIFLVLIKFLGLIFYPELFI